MVQDITFRHLGPSDLDLLLSVRDGLFDNPVDPVQAAAFLADPRLTFHTGDEIVVDGGYTKF